MSQVVGLDMVTGMGFIGLEPGRLYKIGQSPKLKDQTASGNPLLLNSAEAPLTALSLYGWSKQDGTPTPENPVPIVSAGSVMVESKNLFNYKNLYSSMTSGGATIVNNSDGSFTISGEGQLTSVFAKYYDDYDLVKKLKVGTISLSTLAVTKPYFYVQLKNETGDSLLYILNMDEATMSGEITEDILAQTKYVRYGFYGSIDEVIVPGTVFPMVYQDGDGTYEPYFTPYADPDEGEINVTVQGGNLADVLNPDNWVYNAENGPYLSYKIPVPSGTYTISMSQNNMNKNYFTEHGINDAIALYFGGTPGVASPNKLIGNSGLTNTATTTTSVLGSVYLNLYYYSGSGQQITSFTREDLEYIFSYVPDFMLNAGSTALPYMPYKQPQTLTAQTPGGLAGIPVSSGGNYTDESGQQWICDEVDFERGKYVKRVNMVTFDGSEDEFWRKNDAVETNYMYYINQSDKKLGNVICNRLVASESALPNGDRIGIGGNYGSIPSVLYVNFGTAIGDNNAKSFKAYLQSYPITVLYALADPIETDLSDEEMAAYKTLHTYSPATTVSNDADVRMGVGYKK